MAVQQPGGQRGLLARGKRAADVNWSCVVQLEPHPLGAQAFHRGLGDRLGERAPVQGALKGVAEPVQKFVTADLGP